jgi:hypothetical protein
VALFDCGKHTGMVSFVLGNEMTSMMPPGLKDGTCNARIEKDIEVI